MTLLMLFALFTSPKVEVLFRDGAPLTYQIETAHVAFSPEGGFFRIDPSQPAATHIYFINPLEREQERLLHTYPVPKPAFHKAQYEPNIHSLVALNFDHSKLILFSLNEPEDVLTLKLPSSTSKVHFISNTKILFEQVLNFDNKISSTVYQSNLTRQGQTLHLTEQQEIYHVSISSQNRTHFIGNHKQSILPGFHWDVFGNQLCTFHPSGELRVWLLNDQGIEKANHASMTFDFVEQIQVFGQHEVLLIDHKQTSSEVRKVDWRTEKADTFTLPGNFKFASKSTFYFTQADNKTDQLLICQHKE